MEAISLMRSLKIRRLLVVRKEKTREVQLGLATLMSMLGSIDVVQIESSFGKEVVANVCSYCESKCLNIKITQ